MLEIRSDWDRFDAVGNPVFTIFITKQNGQSLYFACSGDCMDSDYKTYQTLKAGLTELLHKAFPVEVMQEIKEMKRILREIK